MYEDRIGLEKCLPRQQNKCRERHVQAAINAPQYSYFIKLYNLLAAIFDFSCHIEFQN